MSSSWRRQTDLGPTQWIGRPAGEGEAVRLAYVASIAQRCHSLGDSDGELVRRAGAGVGGAIMCLGCAPSVEEADAVARRLAANLALLRLEDDADLAPVGPVPSSTSLLVEAPLLSATAVSAEVLSRERGAFLVPPLLGTDVGLLGAYNDKVDGEGPMVIVSKGGPKPQAGMSSLSLLVRRDPAVAPRGRPPIFPRPRDLPGQKLYADHVGDPAWDVSCEKLWAEELAKERQRQHKRNEQSWQKRLAQESCRGALLPGDGS